MQSNLQKLYITPEDLKTIAAVSQRDLKAYEQLKYPRLALLMTIGSYVERILLLGWGLIPLGYLIKWKWLRKRQKSLLEEIDKYNTVIQGIEINDQLVAAGNKSASLTDREKLISTLETTRENLICALKTERILRENRAFIARNKELLATNLAAVQALQISYEAREYTKLLNEALEAAQAVQGEMKRLESGESDL
ncbi:hypothetical protein [Microseira sp. BLCC-F43]|jgi:hypothetical protein|uniref:hypothetical protein n=1 Tax=Microseira sp. BLCC-F43 TaxID=3153602 RepID=UPI0035BA5F9A